MDAPPRLNKAAFYSLRLSQNQQFYGKPTASVLARSWHLEYFMEVMGQQINCSFCLTIFSICHSCFRGQKFCSSDCRIAGRRARCKEAHQRYQKSDRGRRFHRLRQDSYRKRKKDVTHPSSANPPNTIEPSGVKLTAPSQAKNSGIRCQYCEQKIHFFLNEQSFSPATDRRRKRRKKYDRNRGGGSDPPSFLR